MKLNPLAGDATADWVWHIWSVFARTKTSYKMRSAFSKSNTVVLGWPQWKQARKLWWFISLVQVLSVFWAFLIHDLLSKCYDALNFAVILTTVVCQRYESLLLSWVSKWRNKLLPTVFERSPGKRWVHGCCVVAVSYISYILRTYYPGCYHFHISLVLPSTRAFSFSQRNRRETPFSAEDVLCCIPISKIHRLLDWVPD